jgi:hypothetical protein
VPVLRRLVVWLLATGVDTLLVSETTQPQSRLNVALLLLQAGVPLSLLVDLTSQKGPDSSLISVQERLAEPLPLVPDHPDRGELHHS